MRELFVSARYPTYQLARYVLEREALNGEAPELVESLRDSLQNVESLQELLFSDHMYLNQQVYDKFCKAMESGVLRGTFQTRPQPLEASVSPWHEAHFRLAPFFYFSSALFYDNRVLTHFL